MRNMGIAIFPSIVNAWVANNRVPMFSPKADSVFPSQSPTDLNFLGG
jgi:hypothetical protein